MVIHVAVDAGASGPVVNTASISGGGAATPATASEQNAVSATPAPFGVAQFHNHITGPDGKPETQAGAHPYQLTTKISLANKIHRPEGLPGTPVPHASEDPKNVVVDLPLGFLGSAQAAPTCTVAQLTTLSDDGQLGGCPKATALEHGAREGRGCDVWLEGQRLGLSHALRERRPDARRLCAAHDRT